MAAQNKKAFILKSLQQQGREQAQNYRAGKEVSDDFIKNGKRGNDMIQLSHGKLFCQFMIDKQWKVIGDPDSTSFFLDDDSTSYPAINRYFRCCGTTIAPFGISYRAATKQSIITFETHSDGIPAPPKKLLRPENLNCTG